MITAICANAERLKSWARNTENTTKIPLFYLSGNVPRKNIKTWMFGKLFERVVLETERVLRRQCWMFLCNLGSLLFARSRGKHKTKLGEGACRIEKCKRRWNISFHYHRSTRVSSSRRVSEKRTLRRGRREWKASSTVLHYSPKCLLNTTKIEFIVTTPASTEIKLN